MILCADRMFAFKFLFPTISYFMAINISDRCAWFCDFILFIITMKIIQSLLEIELSSFSVSFSHFAFFFWKRGAWVTQWLGHARFDSKTTEFKSAGINIFWARLRLVLARAVRRGLKWVLRRAQYVQEHNLYYYYLHLGAHCEKRNWKNKQQKSL